eukprot:TRINITY_DN2940_c0_g1_i1.p1 TRINITY_DN2940_c0_g1~~TRINITY_DN2940_c0_g1_i1.p1  ORF type:complete len:227 (+),score=51.14 TRINITY_DN2940_c0_g1_i1:163-843(+)
MQRGLVGSEMCIRDSKRPMKKGEVSQDNEGIKVEDFHLLLQKIYFAMYKCFIEKKKELQLQRVEAFEEEKFELYIELLRKTKILEDQAYEEAERITLESLGVNQKSWVLEKEKSGTPEARAEAIEEVAKHIKDNAADYGLDPTKVTELLADFEKTYEEAKFVLSAQTDVDRVIRELFPETDQLKNQYILISDMLYKKYSLLPIELESLVQQQPTTIFILYLSLIHI